MNKSIDRLAEIISRSEQYQKNKLLKAPSGVENSNAYQKEFKRIFNVSESAELVGVDRAQLADAETLIGITPVKVRAGPGYTLRDIQAFRSYFQANNWRNPDTDSPMLVAIQNYKGGVGKSTVCVSLAHYLALVRGYRVLLIDVDSQATATAMFGYVPDVDIRSEHTILPYLLSSERQHETLHYAVRSTYFPGIDLIPACLALYGAETSFALDIGRRDSHVDQRVALSATLAKGIHGVSGSYDIILIDSPPGPGMISLSALIAADGLVVPAPPRMADYWSTIQYFRLIYEYLSQVETDKEFLWLRVLPTQVHENYASHKRLRNIMNANFKELLIDPPFYHSTQIINSWAKLRTPYEEEKPDRGALAMMNDVFREIEALILRQWPSKTTTSY